MSGKGKRPDVRNPKTASYLESLSTEEAAGHPSIVLEQGGVCSRYWLEDGKVRSCEVGEAGLPLASENPSGLASVLERARSDFSKLLPRAANRCGPSRGEWFAAIEHSLPAAWRRLHWHDYQARLSRCSLLLGTSRRKGASSSIWPNSYR